MKTAFRFMLASLLSPGAASFEEEQAPAVTDNTAGGAAFAGWGGTRGTLMLALLCAILLVAVPPAHGQTETVLYSFCPAGYPCPDGANPVYVTLALDKKGNLYGTTEYGGANGYGTLFKVAPSGAESVVYSFQNNGVGGGFNPFSGVVLDSKGNLYGTGPNGGVNFDGAVYQVTPSGTLNILWSFAANGTDGFSPAASVVRDKLGNLYGTTYIGGHYNSGTVFALTPSGTETILHSFNFNGSDGFEPQSPVVLDKEGNLYGTTVYGGVYGSAFCCGTVFEVTPSGTETVLWSFGNGSDGYSPLAGLVRDAKGNLYGTTSQGGSYGGGIVFKVTPSGTETILWNFGNGTDGYYPVAGLVRDKKGNLYGTTSRGGAYGGGTVFKVSPSGVETILWNFGKGTDGSSPDGGLVFDRKGNLYGTTYKGGTYNAGTVFRLTP